MSRSRLLSLVLLLGACARKDAEEDKKGAESAALPQVQVLLVAPRSLAPRLPLYGVLAPLPGRDIKVGALVPGRVAQLLVAEGDPVKAGQPLALIEAQLLRNRVAEVDAQIAQAQAALSNARTRLSRSEKLFGDGVAARQEVDDDRAAVVAAESALRQARSSQGSAGVQLDRATLRAPFAGVVAAILVPAGQPVDGSGSPVVEVADTRELDLRCAVPAARAAAVHIDDQAEITITGMSEPLRGSVAAVAPLVDPQSGTVLVRVRIHNEDGRLRGGQYARGQLLGASHAALAIPRSALLPGEGGAADAVAVVGADGAVAHHTLQLGGEDQGWLEVLGGLQAGERVITRGGYALPDGTKVAVAP